MGRLQEVQTTVRSYATLGEICGTMRQVFGEYIPVTVI
jgi:methylmalonyl-CoA mutase N-terminal domain/subunit